MKDSIKNTKQNLLYFIVQKTQLCVALESVIKVTPLVYLELVPNSPSYLVGLMNLAGESIAIIDLAMALGLNQNKQYTLTTPILICGSNKHKIGMIVDEIIDVVEADTNTFQMQNELDKKESPYLASIVLNGNLTMMLNVENIANLSYLNDQDRFAVEGKKI